MPGIVDSLTWRSRAGPLRLAAVESSGGYVSRIPLYRLRGEERLSGVKRSRNSDRSQTLLPLPPTVLPPGDCSMLSASRASAFTPAPRSAGH